MAPKYIPLEDTDLDHEFDQKAWRLKSGSKSVRNLVAISVILLLLVTNFATILHFSAKSYANDEIIPKDYGIPLYPVLVLSPLTEKDSITRLHIPRQDLEPILVEHRV